EEEEEDEYHSDEDDDDANEVVEEPAEELQPEEEAVPELPGPPATPEMKPCDIVDKLFKDGSSLQEACKQKYDGKYYGWKCISGATTGGLCIPPRRRKLYLHKMEGDEVKDATALRTWFVKSAAVETFFLWHRYKQLNGKGKDTQGAGESPPGLSNLSSGYASSYSGSESEEKTPKKSLQDGEIPDGFLRQMFYTIADYRDILVRGGGDTNSGSEKDGGDSSNNNNIVFLASGKENEKKMKQIQDKIDEILRKTNSENQATSGAPQPQQQQQPSGQQRENLWSTFAQPIWNGMICALTYTEKSVSGQKPQITQDNDLKKALLDTDGKKPKPKTDGTNGKDYTYGGVRLEDENSGTQALSPNAPASPTSPQANGARLADFTSRPAYFRWLEEWGESFCRERKRRLEKIREECTEYDGGRKTKCSGDGFECTKNGPNKDKNFKAFDCSSCAKYCRFYRKWIKTKRTEYEEQEKIYGEQKGIYVQQKTDAEGNKGAKSINNDNAFSTTLDTCTKAADFLEELKIRPCKSDNDNGGSDIKFSNTNVTFGPGTNCAPCSQFTVKCNGNVCSGTKGDCNGGTITAEKFDTMVNSPEEVVMRVSDNNTNGNKFDDLQVCENAHIFKGIRKDVWKCGNVCGYNVCKPKNVNGKKNENQIILISALFKRWLEYFFEDYNRIRKKK
ncbi:hypothetical protein PFTANZ_06078, partial [Plasmodium falciparum Tanzania (2000708)]